MKCENCGKEEVNFHFTSNINGNITEKHLCAECAGKLGYTDAAFTKQEASFEDIFADLFGARPNKRAFGGFGLVFPTLVIPTIGFLVPDTGTDETEGAPPQEKAGIIPEINQEIDAEMKKRREVNVLREQMKRAVETEDFEKAAALRDSIKLLEIGEHS